MQIIFAGLIFIALILYMDDVLVADRDIETHLKHLRLAFERLRATNAKLEPNKCNFNYQKLSILGSIVDQDGISVDTTRTDSVLKAPPPHNVRSLQRFLGMVGWFRKSIPNLSIISKPLYNILRQDILYKWETVHQQAMNKLKQILTNPPLLHWFNETRKTILVTDASKAGLGSPVLQELDNGTLVPIAFYSSSLNKAQANYAAMELKMLALAMAVKVFHCYLAQIHFFILTDSQPITCLRYGTSNKRQATCMQLWSLALADYNFTIIYKPGKHIELADWLSRDTAPQLPSPESVLDIPDLPFSSTLITDTAPIPLYSNHKANLQELHALDAECQELTTFLQNNNPKYTRRYELKQGILVNTQSGYARPVVPVALRLTLLNEFHDSISTGGHSGFSKTYNKLETRFFWGKLKADVYNYVTAIITIYAK